MKTKQEYIDTLVCITKEYYSTVRSPEEVNKFNSYLRLFEGLVDEYFEENKETNFEHFKNEIKDKQFDFAVMDGKVLQCKNCFCDGCLFNSSNCMCDVMKIKWLYKLHKKKYKLTQFEYDLLNAYKNSGMRQCISNYGTLLELYKKGYFKDIGTSIPIHEILDNYEVIQ